MDIDLDGTAWIGEGLDIETSNGGVKLALPENYSARLEARTENGARPSTGVRIQRNRGSSTSLVRQRWRGVLGSASNTWVSGCTTMRTS